jgi:hypothetical protein
VHQGDGSVEGVPDFLGEGEASDGHRHGYGEVEQEA